MLNIKNAKHYSMFSGLVLFLLGLFGFSFRESFSGIGDIYLFFSIVLGFWGLFVSFVKKEEADKN